MCRSSFFLRKVKNIMSNFVIPKKGEIVKTCTKYEVFMKTKEYQNFKCQKKEKASQHQVSRDVLIGSSMHKVIG